MCTLSFRWNPHSKPLLIGGYKKTIVGVVELVKLNSYTLGVYGVGGGGTEGVNVTLLTPSQVSGRKLPELGQL